MALVAVSMKFTPITLDENGHEREARRLHSITLTSPSLAMSCMLKGPVIFSAAASFSVISSTFLMSASSSVWGGSMSDASPECTPAFSTCSEIALSSTLPSLATASTVLLGDAGCFRQEAGELVGRVGDVHSGAREDVRRADEARIAHALAEFEGILRGGQQLPSGLVDANRIAKRGKLVAVLCGINHGGRGASNVDAGVAHLQRKRVRDLTTY
eukprot:scaffold156435_cov24-Tisochrysis_lutea.AAC.1